MISTIVIGAATAAVVEREGVVGSSGCGDDSGPAADDDVDADDAASAAAAAAAAASIGPFAFRSPSPSPSSCAKEAKEAGFSRRLNAIKRETAIVITPVTLVNKRGDKNNQV
jgi:hypothetical protein